MATTIKKPKNHRSPETTVITELPQGVYQRIHTCKIVISKNYRGLITNAELQELAEDIKIRDIISPVTVRPLPSGDFELVAGERRVRAAIIAGRDDIPCMVIELSDDEVLEIQLSENLNRENPHPLREAFAILQMQQNGKSVEDICLRLAKSKSFVHQRLRLVNLSENFQPVFLAGVISLKQSLQLAELSLNSQNEIYEEHFQDWNQENFEVDDNLDYFIENLRFELSKANFSIRSKSLIPEAGACIGCRFNSATLGSLFPELAKRAVCSHAACFQQKSLAHYRNLFNKAVEKEKPQALIVMSNNELIEHILENYEPAKAFPVYRYYDVNVVSEPVQPEPEDYEEETIEDGEPQFDKAGFEQAVAEYNEELEAFASAKQSGELKKALFLKRDEISPLWFGERYQSTGSQFNKPKVTAKAVQEAIKSGVATAELLQSEINRIEARERRSKELDKEKVQLQVHEAFKASREQPISDLILTQADLIAMRFLAYESLDWSAKQKADKLIFGSIDRNDHDTFYTKLSELTEPEQAYLVRLAIAEKSGSQYPQQAAGQVLYHTAAGMGIDIEAIEQAQSDKAKERKEKMDARIAELQEKIKEFH